MIEIDRVMFVSCRLCVEKLGDYQIVPSIQEQIKFCYDIEVNPFDGLPQLICKECESMLSNFAAVKNAYIDKQKNIKPALKDKIAKLTKDAMDSEHEIISATAQLSAEKENKRKKTFAIHSSSSDGSITDSSLRDTVEKKRKAYKRIKRQKSSDFSDANYEKVFICRFCNKSLKSRPAMIKHIDIHSSILCKYQTYIKGRCYVRLNRVDDKSNICKSKNIVVLSRDRFLKSEHDYYYSVFIPKTLANISSEQSSLTGFEKVAKSCSSSEISNSELNLKNKKKKRRKTKISGCSKKIIVVEDHNMISTKCNTLNDTTRNLTIPSDCKSSKSNECIDVCDYSDSESCKIVSVEKNYSVTNLNQSSRTSEFKTIQNVISVCLKKYLNKIKSVQSVPQLSRVVTDKQLDYSIKHEVLSIGKKIINSPEFSYMGILRYLEQQNLEIAWIPKPQSNIKKPDYVRIMIKLKDYNDNEHYNLGWQKLENINNENCNSEILRPSIIEKNSVKECLRESNIMEATEVLTKHINKHETVEKKDADKMLKKLLNQNPVSNPKQLPKKNISLELFTNTNDWNATDKMDQSVAVDVENNVISGDVFQMPVITSAVSLAPVLVESESQKLSLTVLPSVTNQNINNEPHPPLDTVKNFPRIKVKPVTELMSDKVLNSTPKHQIHQDNNVTSNQNGNMIFQNNSFNVGYAPELPIPELNHVQNYPLQVNSKQTGSGAKINDKREYVIMDSVEIPCKRTDSPFRYLKDLLHIHNIILLDVNETMSRDFTCLLKFKLMFQQVSNSPVILCLALFYSKKRFCLKVRDISQKEIDISRLSANWQWEILKIYRGEVVAKLLENAQKLGPDACQVTSKFLCYLKSINFWNET